LGRELRASGGLLLAITSIIAVGVVCYVSMASTYRNLQESKSRYYRQCRMADFSIELKKVPSAELAAVAELPGVAEIRTRIQFFATVDVPGVAEPLNGQVLSLPDRRKPTINDIVLRRGSYFTNQRDNEVIVNEGFAEKHGLCPGQWIHLVLNNRRQELFIVGTAISSEFVYLVSPGAIVPDPEHFGVFYLKHTYAEDVFDFDGAANQVLGLLTPDAKSSPRAVLQRAVLQRAVLQRAVLQRAVLQRAEQMLAPYGVFTTTPRVDQPSNRYLSQEIQGLESFAVVMPVIFLAVAALVLNVLLTRLAQQQRIVVGTLKALGYTNRQVFVHFLKLGMTVGVVGGLLGCAIGYVFAGFMTNMYQDFFKFPDLDNRFYPTIHCTGVAISLACAVVGSLRGTRGVLRLQPAEAMRPQAPRAGGAVLLERVAWLWSRLSSGWRTVLRSMVRSRVRTAAGVFAAAMGAAILSSGFMMAQAGPYLIDFQFKWMLRSDIDLTLKDERSEDALLEAARLPGVDLAEPMLSVAGTFHNGPYRKKGGITGISPGARLTVPRDLHARPVRVPSAGLAMSRKLAEILHVERGDVVAFEPIKGVRRTYEVPVLEIADSYLGTAVYADIHWLSGLIHEELAVNGIQLATDGDPAHLAALYRQLKRLPALEAVNCREDTIRNLEKTLVQNMMGFSSFS
jgi:putative ABC transport system permease protein